MKRDRYKATGPEGYMTLEASFIVPLIFMIMVLIMYFTFYLYNHLVVEQSCYLAALRGSELKNSSDAVVESYVQEQAEKLLDEQIFQYQIEDSVSVSLLRVDVEASSSIENKLRKLGIYDEESMDTSREEGVLRLDPATVIRPMHGLGKK